MQREQMPEPNPQNQSELLPVAPPSIELPKDPKQAEKSGRQLMDAVAYENAVQEAARIAEENMPKVAASGGSQPPDDPNGPDNFYKEYYKKKNKEQLEIPKQYQNTDSGDYSNFENKV